jgi:hypothetical protein
VGKLEVNELEKRGADGVEEREAEGKEKIEQVGISARRQCFGISDIFEQRSAFMKI